MPQARWKSVHIRDSLHKKQQTYFLKDLHYVDLGHEVMEVVSIQAEEHCRYVKFNKAPSYLRTTHWESRARGSLSCSRLTGEHLRMLAQQNDGLEL